MFDIKDEERFELTYWRNLIKIRMVENIHMLTINTNTFTYSFTFTNTCMKQMFIITISRKDR